VTDPVVDDQSLAIETDKELSVVLGCSHSDIVNTLNDISEKSRHSRFRTIIGSTHLGYANEEQVARTIDALLCWDIERLGASHCTSNQASMRLANGSFYAMLEREFPPKSIDNHRIRFRFMSDRNLNARGFMKARCLGFNVYIRHSI
jgi:hypothetical protein